MLSGCGAEASLPEDTVSRPIKTLVVGHDSTWRVKHYPGKVRAIKEVDLSFRIAGPLIELPIMAGQHVKKGQVIARMDPRDFTLRRNRAKALYDEAKRQYDRHLKLLNKKAVAQAEFDAVETNYQTALANYKEAEAALQDTWLRAPFDGVVARRFVENHQDVKEKVRIVSLQDISKLEVEVQVPERDIANKGVINNVDLSVRFDAVPGINLPAEVKEFSSVADQASQTFSVKVVFEKPEGLNVLPGMTAELLARSKPSNGGASLHFLVPLGAVFSDATKQDNVWKVDQQAMTVHKARVSVIRLEDTFAVVGQGLKPGDVIVTAGVHHLRDGARVHFMDTGEKAVAK